MAKVSGLCTIPQLAAWYLWFDKVKGRFFVLAKKRDWFVHVSKKELLVDGRPLVQRPEVVIPEEWQRAEKMDSTVQYVIYMIYESVTTIVMKYILYMEGEK